MDREEAIKKVRQMSLPKETMEILEALAPELRESEDERIRKALIEALTVSKSIGELKFRLPEPTREECITWLEKQKEDKWSPSEDEMGVLYKLCYISSQVTDEDDTNLTRLYQDLKREYFNGHSFENMFPSEKQKKPKSLINKLNENIRERLIKYFQGFLEGYEDCYKVGGHVKWEGMDVKDILAYLEGKPDFCHHEVDLSNCSDEYCRAYYDGWNNCNQQHAQLEAEQKPAEWSEEDSRKIGTLSSIIFDYAFYKDALDENKDLKGEYAELDIWLGELPERFNLPPKQEWSEEDEKFAYFVNQFLGYHEKTDPTAASCKKWFNNRLKSIKLQSKAEWSEDEKKMLAVISYKISQHQGNDKRSLFTPDEAEFISEMEDKFKSLRSHPLWKLSEEQTNCLMKVITWLTEAGNLVDSGILADLKKQLETR